MDKRHQNELKKLAQKCLKHYRASRAAGSTPRLARVHAHFAIMCLSGGRLNLFAQNLLRRYKK